MKKECECNSPYVYYNEGEQPVMLVSSVLEKGYAILKINFCPFCGKEIS
jgi:hypothetical protein